MRKNVCFFAVFLCVWFGIAAQRASGENGDKEVKNTIGAVKTADGGDYILLKSGRKYVLTQEEIDILNGVFDYEDLSDVKTETREDGTKIKTISEAHVAYLFPDGQSQHLLKSSRSFTLYVQQYIEKNYFLGHYVDISGDYHDSRPHGSPRFYVFRAIVQFQTISDGVNEAERVLITAYNYKNENFVMRYYSTDEGWRWGHVSGSYQPKGQSHEIEFDIE